MRKKKGLDSPDIHSHKQCYTLSVEDVVDILEKTIQNEKFVATAESKKQLRTRTILANIKAKIVNISPRATIKIDDDIVYIENVEGLLKNDKKNRQEIIDYILETYSVNDVIFTTPTVAKNDYVNPFYNPG